MGMKVGHHSTARQVYQPHRLAPTCTASPRTAHRVLRWIVWGLSATACTGNSTRYDSSARGAWAAHKVGQTALDLGRPEAAAQGYFEARQVAMQADSPAEVLRLGLLEGYVWLRTREYARAAWAFGATLQQLGGVRDHVDPALRTDILYLLQQLALARAGRELALPAVWNTYRGSFAGNSRSQLVQWLDDELGPHDRTVYAHGIEASAFGELLLQLPVHGATSVTTGGAE